MDRRTFVGLGMGGMALLGLAVVGHAAITAGKEYIPLTQPLPVESGDKIEVTEFFWYGCPHCFDLEPGINKWQQTLPKDVEFRRQPTIFRDSWVPGARLYYTLEAMGEVQRLHAKIFSAIHADHVNLDNEPTLLDWLAKQGVDRNKYTATSRSFSVETKVKRAEQISRMSKISGVPAVIVDGTYMTSVALAGTEDAMFATVEQLIQKARGERKKK